jgi:serine/threonine protein phosphatase PrpC
MADVDLEKLLEPHQKTLKEMGQQLAAGQHEKFIANAATLVGVLATGSPHVALLAPFAEKAVAGAFASAADKRLQREIEAMEREDDRKAFVAQIGDAVQALLDQAIVQIVRVQHNVKDELRARLREDLADFRGAFQQGLGDHMVRLDEQVVRDGATGVRVGPNATKRVFIGRMEVAGKGSVGIDLG